jgi:II/X family phage/plasmid replication protein
MGLDTIKLKSPPVSEAIMRKVEQHSIQRRGIDLRSGEVLYEITTGELSGSWDARISVRPMREEWVSNKNGRPELRPCEPYLILECSAAKALNGQNVYGAPTYFLATCQALVELIEDILGVELMPARHWIVRRVDCAENYALPMAAIIEYFRGIYTAQFPRRKAQKYGDHAIYFPGSTTTVKLYHKGSEFAEHDRTRLKHFFGQYRRQKFPHAPEQNRAWVERKIKALQRLANNRLRVEVEIHADKLDFDFNHQPRVDEVSDAYLMGVHDHEIQRLLKEGKSGMHTVRLSKAVHERLIDTYGDTAGNRLHGFWCQLSSHGEIACKRQYSKSVFYRNRSQLVASGVSWNNTDVKLIRVLDSNNFEFAPVRASQRLCVGRVREKPAFIVDRDFLKLAA